MSTTRAAIASLVGVGLALVLGVAGAVAIYNTKDGQVHGSDTPEVPFPATPTGAMAVLDENGTLASLIVMAIRPAGDGDDAGVGGTIVPVPVSADVSGGLGPERLPLDETVALFGGESLEDEVPALLGVSIDQVAVVTEAELATMFGSLEATEVVLPDASVRSDGTVIAEAGAQTLDGAQMAAVLASRDTDLTGAEEYGADVAVWVAIASALGEEPAPPLALEIDEPTAAAAGEVGISELVGLLTSGPVSVQPLRTDPVVSVDLNPRGVDAAALDRVEVAVIFGHIAPSRVAAPYPGYTFRVVSSYGDDQLPGGVVRLDVAYTATKALFEFEANVRSVDTVAGDAEPNTIVEVANDSLIPAGERLVDILGPVEVRVAGIRIAGIDMVVTLGTDYLDTLDAGAATDSAGTSGRQDTIVEETVD